MQYSDVSACAVSSLSNANKTVAFAFGDFFRAGSKPKFVGARGKIVSVWHQQLPGFLFSKSFEKEIILLLARR
jgi:hypothetical protein